MKKSLSKGISLCFIVSTLLLSLLVIIDWLTPRHYLRSVIPGLVSFKFNLALGFGLVSAVLLMYFFPGKNKTRYHISVLLSVIVCFIGLATFAEYFFGFNMGIDELFVKDSVSKATTYYAGRMSPLSAVNLLLVGIGFFILNKERTATYQFFYLSGIIFVSLMMLVTFNFVAGVATFINLSVYDTIGFILLSGSIYFAQPMLQKKISFEQMLFTNFSAIIILILVLSIFSSYYSARRIETSRWIQHSNDVIKKSEQILSLTKDIEAISSNYMITGDSNYIENFMVAKDSILNYSHKLKYLTKDNPRQQTRIDSLSALIGQRIGFSIECIRAKNHGDFDLSKVLMATLRSKSYSNGIKKISLEIQLEENNLLAQREKDSHKSIVSFNRAFFVLLGGILVLFIIIIISVRRDNSFRKKAAEKIKESEHLFSTLFYKSPVLKAIVETATDSYIEVNDAFANFLGYTKEDIPGKTSSEINMFDNAENRARAIKNMQNDGFVREFEMQLSSNDGKSSWVSANFDTVNVNGKDCFLFSGIDITKRKIAEDNLITLSEELEDIVLKRTHELNVSEKSYRYLFENSPMPMWVISLNTLKFLDINEMAILQYGYSREEFLSMTAVDIRPDDEKELYKKSDHSPDNDSKNFKKGIWNHRKKDGTVIQVEVIGHGIIFEGLPARLILSNDVTERKQAEEKLIASEKRFRYTLDTMLEGAQIIGFDWRYKYVNDSMARHGRYSKEELLGYTVMEKYPGIEKSEIFQYYQQCFNERVIIHVENEFMFPDQTKGWFELSFQPVTEGIFILSIDITDRKKAQFEIEKLNEELEQKVIDRTEQLQIANKELEAFSYSVSHDLRAPLRAINGFAKKLAYNYETSFDSEGHRLFNRIKINAVKMGVLIDNLLEFSKLGRKEIHKSPIQMTQLVESALLEINTTVDHEAQVKIDQLHCANADIEMIRQVMINLLSNAIKYSSKTEKPCVEIKSRVEENEIIYSVKDNGIGFNNVYVEKLFGVFQRLHLQSDFEGTGVGLALVKRIVNKHGGRVWAEGQLNKGATFCFSLPGDC